MGARWSDNTSKGKEMAMCELHWVHLAVLEGLFKAVVRLGGKIALRQILNGLESKDRAFGLLFYWQ